MVKKSFVHRLGNLAVLLLAFGSFVAAVIQPYPLQAQQAPPQGTVAGRVRAQAGYVKGARIYQLIPGSGWKHVATTYGMLTKKGCYQFTTDTGTYDFKAQWGGREQIIRNVRVEADPKVTELDFVIPPKAD
jgi:hypothetical protein